MPRAVKPDDEGPVSQVEWVDCPTCEAPAGNPCRTTSGDTAFRYHTARFILVPALQAQPEVLVPADLRPGEPWVARPTAGMRAGVVRIGYAAAGLDAQEAREQIKALRSAGCERILVEQTDPLAGVRPTLARALVVARERAASVLGRTVVLVTAVELRRLARTSHELIALVASAQSDGVRLEVLTGPLAGIHGADGPALPLFAVLAEAGRLDREHGREKVMAGQRAAAAAGRRSGRPKVFDEALLAEARRLREEGVPVPEIAARLVITTGKNAGGHPSVASVYRALEQP